MKKEKRFPNFQDLYSFQDYKLAMQVVKTYKCGLSPVCLKAPEQTSRYLNHIIEGKSGNDTMVTKRTLKLEYAIQVWTKAALMVSRDYWQLRYEDNETSFREVVYYEREDITRLQLAIDEFWKLLEQIADSGQITVHEGYSFGNTTYDKWGHKIWCNIVLDKESVKNFEVNDIFSYPYDLTLKTFTWEQIKDMFVQLSLHQLSLTNIKKLHKCTKLDNALFYACNQLDHEMVKAAIRIGANVNAINENGETPLTKAIEDFPAHGVDTNKEMSDEEWKPIEQENYKKCVKVVDCLLDAGADVDLFGVGGIQPIVEAYYAHSFDMVKHLLERGSDPNYNSFRDDDIDWLDEDSTHCTILKNIDELLYEEYDEFAEKTEDVLHQYSARLYDWDLDVDRGIHIGKYYILMSPARPTYLFYDNCWAIGNEDEITIEDADANKTTLKLQKIKGLKEWHDEYTQNIEKPDFDWKEWRARGFKLAQQVAKQLPESVALYFPYGEDPEIEYFHLENRHYLRSLSEKILVTP